MKKIRVGITSICSGVKQPTKTHYDWLLYQYFSYHDFSLLKHLLIDTSLYWRLDEAMHEDDC